MVGYEGNVTNVTMNVNSTSQLDIILTANRKMASQFSQ